MIKDKILNCLDVLNHMTVTGRGNCWAIAAVSGTLEEILNELETDSKAEQQEDEGDG